MKALRRKRFAWKPTLLVLADPLRVRGAVPEPTKANTAADATTRQMMRTVLLWCMMEFESFAYLYEEKKRKQAMQKWDTRSAIIPITRNVLMDLHGQKMEPSVSRWTAWYIVFYQLTKSCSPKPADMIQSAKSLDANYSPVLMGWTHQRRGGSDYIIRLIQMIYDVRM